MTKADLLAAALDDFLEVSPDVEAAAVVSADGLPMASALPPHVEEDRLAAMSAALLTLGERAAQGLGKGDLAQVFVEGEQGYVVLMSAGEAVLVAVTSKDSKVGLILYEMRRYSERIAAVMEQEPVPASAPVEPAGDVWKDESFGAPTHDEPAQPAPSTWNEEPVAPPSPEQQPDQSPEPRVSW